MDTNLPHGRHGHNTVTVHVEVRLKPTSTARHRDIKGNIVFRDTAIDFSDDEYLSIHVAEMIGCDISELKHDSDSNLVRAHDAVIEPEIHVYQLNEEGPEDELDEGNENVSCTTWTLPASGFHMLWENLIFDSSIKNSLIGYVSTALQFTEKDVDEKIVAWNRVVLLHGPAGTGKTSLCRALAHKLSIRFADRFSCGLLVEINAHSLFSKWFSESGKLVLKLFEKIKELIEDKDTLVCVLIDEVESLTAARSAAIHGSEPSDAIRVVNAVLTQVDQLKTHSNVVVLTTSNITAAVDDAFVDRADIKQYIGLPSTHTRYKILLSCVNELMRKDLIQPTVNIPQYEQLEEGEEEGYDEEEQSVGNALKKAAVACDGLSGRALRKLPFIAHALFIQQSSSTITEFLTALHHTAERECESRRKLQEEKMNM